MSRSRNWLALGLFGLALGVGAGPVRAQSEPEKDLTVEIARPHRPPHYPAYGYGLKVSLLPIGSSSIAVGEPIGFRLLATGDAYGDLYVLSASGKTQVWLENVPLRAGRPLVYPPPGKIVRATPPAGDETILFVATRWPIHGFAGPGPTMTPLDVGLGHDDLRGALEAKLASRPRRAWAMTEIEIRVND